MMNYKVNTTLIQFAARLALLAGVIAMVSAALGIKVLALTEADPSGVGLLAVPAGQAYLVTWSFALSSLGNYLLLIPLAAVLCLQAGSVTKPWHLLIGICGVAYLLLGGVGAVLLASSWSAAIITYQTAPVMDQELLAQLLHTRQQATEALFQGRVQNWLGGLWFAGVAMTQTSLPKPLTILSWLLASTFGITLCGDLADAPAVIQTGVAATVLLLPPWAICMGFAIGLKPWRQSPDEVAVQERP